MIHTTAIVFGSQGSGKSNFARFLARLKRSEGYHVIVFDTDSNRREWGNGEKGIESFHDPLEIVKILMWFVAELDSRYEDLRDGNLLEEEWRKNIEGKKGRQGKVAIIGEEITKLEGCLKRIPLEQLEAIGCTDLMKLLHDAITLPFLGTRKVLMPFTFVTHSDTQGSFPGKIENLSKLLGKTAKVELKGTRHPETQQLTATMEGVLSLEDSTDKIPVRTFYLREKIRSFSTPKEASIIISESDPQEIQERSIIISDSEPKTETLKTSIFLSDSEIPESVEVTPEDAPPQRILDSLSPHLPSMGEILERMRSTRERTVGQFLKKELGVTNAKRRSQLLPLLQELARKHNLPLK